MTDTLTQEDVELFSGVKDPENHAHYIRKQHFGGECEALCGYRWRPTMLKEETKHLPVCPPCQAIYNDDDAIGMARNSSE